MGKRRKSSKKVVTKVKPKLSTSFKCPYCAHEKSCEVKIDKEAGTGKIECRICHESFQCRTNALTAAIDVYCEWIDACEEANAVDAAGGGVVAGAGGDPGEYSD